MATVQDVSDVFYFGVWTVTQKGMLSCFTLEIKLKSSSKLVLAARWVFDTTVVFPGAHFKCHYITKVIVGV